MKQKLYILGIISSMILVTGAVFKVNHWPGAGIILTTGTIFLLILFLPAALINNYKANGNSLNKPLYIVTYITCLVIFTAMLFKVQHWPFAGIGLIIAIPFPFVVFLPVWLYVTSKIKNFDINNTIYVLFLLALQAVFSTLLSLNVAKDKIDDSLELSNNLFILNQNIKEYASYTNNSELSLSANDVLKNIEECRQLLFDEAGITRKELQNGIVNNVYLDSRTIARQVLLDSENSSPALKLEESIRNFVQEIEKKSGDQELTKQVEDLFFLNEPEEDRAWADMMFADDYLPWVIVNLDAMENVVRVIQTGVLNR